MTSKRIRPFYCGTQYMEWDESNCCRCKKYYDEVKREFLCDIQQEISMASIDDGTIPEEIAKRMGYTPDRYTWPCAEVEWTEEWKEKANARKS